MNISLPGYVIFRESSHDIKYVVYRGIRESDQTPVLIKTLAAVHPNLEDVARLKNEYELLTGLHSTSVVKAFALETSQHNYFLILEDQIEMSLDKLMRQASLDLVSCWKIAVNIVKALADLQTYELIHKDLQPQNILINPETFDVKLTGFTFATKIPRQRFTIKNPTLLEGTLAYMSPEQTGRMNREVDYRTDFYSLGVTLYKLFTNQLPFKTVDPMELVHAHIAKTPLTPHQIMPAIPPPLSDIIMKLLSKKAEDRYSSSYSLLQDLENSLMEYIETGNVQPFPLGRNDVVRKLQISQKIYGREQEVHRLMEVFEEVCEGTTEMIMVAGYAGIGKTSLVNEIRKPIVERKGIFISGKFDQYKKNIPYNAFIEAFQDLVQQILTENDETIAMWRERLKEALGNNAPVILELIPELRYIIGERLPSSEFDTQETQNRFNFFLQKFISLYATPETPLVIHLDDLQWIDTASLQLIEVTLSTLKTKGLYLIGSYRNNEVSALHPLITTTRRIIKNGGPLTEIELPPLKQKDVNELISDTLHLRPEETNSIAKIVTEKTQGNPFFINQLLQFLYEENLLKFDIQEGKWLWNEEKITLLNVSDNVVDLLILKLQKCSIKTQQILKIASCIGTQFDVKLIAKIAGQEVPEVMKSLMEAIHDGFILPSEDVLYYLWSDSRELAKMKQFETPSSTFRFLHDKVLQAAYSMTDDSERRKYHQQIGRYLLQKYSGYQKEEHIFEIMNQLNSAEDLISDENERKTYAEMNLMAGNKAMRSVAYGNALSFLKLGLNFLPKNNWEIEYSLTFQIYLASAECEYLLLNFDEATRLFDLIMQYAKTIHDKVLVETLRVKLYVSSINYDEALRSGRNALKLMGVELPSRFLKFYVLKEFFFLKLKLFRINLDDVKNFPRVTRQEQLDILNLMALLVTPSYLTSKELFAFVVIKGLNLTLKYGNAPTSGYLFACFGIMTIALFENFKTAFAFGQLATELNLKFEDQKWVGPTKAFVGTFLNHTQNHLKTSVTILQTGFEMSESLGDFNTSVFCLGMMIVDKFLIGDNIDELQGQIKESINYAVKVKSHNRGYVFIALRQTIMALKGETNYPETMSSEGFDEEEFFKVLIEKKFLITLYFAYTYKIQICYLAEDYETVVELSHKTDELTHCALGQPMRNENDFYVALGLADNFRRKEKATQSKYLKQIRRILRRIEAWAKAVPVNNLHKYLLVKAELARISGRKEEAIESYDQAISTAKENGFTQHEAIASELFAKFYLSINKHHLAKQYLMDAHYAYYRWGASSKVSELEKKYPTFLSASAVRGLEKPKLNEAAGSTHVDTPLDLMAVVKTTQAISSEIVLEKLLAQLMQILIETAGAQKAALILEKAGTWVVEAETSEEIGLSPLIGSVPLKDKKDDLSTSIINFVLRTKEQVVLDDAANESIFLADPYIAEKKPQSILCFPLQHQKKLIGALYLENNLTTRAFTPERVEILKLLMTQISTSLENSLLYSHQAELSYELKTTNEKLEDYSHNLERKVYDRTRELNEKNKQLEDTLTQIKEMQKKLIQQEKLVSLGAITKNIATEMRNPLSYIYNFAHLSSTLLDELKQSMPNEGSTEEVMGLLKTNLGKIYDHSKKADEILTSMLQNSRDVEGTKELTDINKLIRDYADLVYYSYYKKDPLFSLTIESNFDPNVPKINVYPQNLGRVFYNIIDNACYATDFKKKELKGDFSPIVSISTKDEPEYITIKIRDNGVGIPEDILKRVFSPFLTTKPSGKGAGMGLSISHDIVVQDHSGTINVLSEAGEFTEVTITLPKTN